MSDEAPEDMETQRAPVTAHLDQVATAVDRWFLACLGPFGSAGKQAVRAVDAVVTSTTRRSKPPREGAPQGPLVTGRADPHDTVSGRFELLSTERLAGDVASTVPHEELEHETLEAGATVAREPAGLLPLMRALAAVVNAHGPVAYRTLPEDPRFWPLIELLASFPAEREALQNNEVEEEGRASCTHSG